jgi:primosomal protein N' (replication factor Y)
LRYAEVAVDSPVGADRAYTYAIPEGLHVTPGQPVLAPFGPRVLKGVVLALSDAAPLAEARDLRGTLGGDLGLDSNQVALARWVARRYCCGLYEAAALMMPPGLRQSVVFGTAEVPPAAGAPLTMAEAALLALIERHGPLTEARLRKAWPDRSRDALLARLEGAGRVERRLVWRAPRLLQASSDLPAAESPALTPLQARAWIEIGRAFETTDRRPVLLHGVTGSGKTELYLRALDRVVRSGEQAIVLVPELALTPQMLDRFETRFPGRVAPLHSGLTPAQHRREWWRVKRGLASVVLGSRSAIFAPVERLGLIVIDEEHEWTYKQQDTTPRYHARDVAEERARLSRALLILGSATPCVESFQAARAGTYRLVSLPERTEAVASDRRGLLLRESRPQFALPDVRVVDMRDELRAGNLGLFSGALRQALAAALAAGEQAILFLNRRGAATFILCRSCGHVLRCRRCDTTLTYHQAAGELVCHVCNDRRPPLSRCPACDSRAIRYFGAGTQRVEAELADRFPTARILRWDRDTARGVRAHADILRRFRGHDADFLVGTQMLAKGLDLPRVTLVGVISADTALYLPDFRAGERTFQLLVQVAGRAGRSGWPGRVFIQSYRPEHAALQSAAHHDYTGFADRELAERRRRHLPPFGRLARLVVLDRSAVGAAARAGQLRARIDQRIAEEGLGDLTVLGPAPAFLSRRRGRFRWQIVLRGRFENVLAGLKLGPGCAVDVDPVSLL